MTASRRTWTIRGILLVTLFVFLVFQGFTQEAKTQTENRDAAAEEPSFPAPEDGEFAEGQIIVKLAQDATQADLADLNRRNDARTEEDLPRSDLNVVDLPDDLGVEEAVERYEDSPDVEYAEPDFVLQPTATSNDPSFSRLYGLNNTGQTSGGTADADIDAPEAWNTTTGAPGTVVAVIDEGVDINHPDLRNNIWVNTDEVPNNNIDDDRNGYVDDVNGYDFANNDASVYDAADGDDHGTHVAGTIAAEGNNGTGVTGVNWRANIMVLKFLGANGGYTSDAVEALNYAVANGARISNNSWGGGSSSTTLQQAIGRADSAGHLFVAAAGNAGTNNDTSPSYPASYTNSNIISVAATNNSDTMASFSNYGATSVDLAAPGVGILSTLPGNTYGSYNGTSMATPHVAGVAALMKSTWPNLDDAKIKERILQTVDKKTNLQGQVATGGRLNAAGALSTGETEASLVVDPMSVDFGGATLLSGRLTSNGNPLSGKQVILEQRPLGASGFSAMTNGARTTDTSGNFSLAGVAPTTSTDYRARFAGDASAGLSPATSLDRRVDVRVQVSLDTETTSLQLGQSRTISGAVSPRHEGSVTLTITRNGRRVASKTVPLTDSGYSFSYKPSKLGTYTFSVSFGKDTDHLSDVSSRRSFKVVK